ncbi:MAG: hypothetical protein ACFCUN_07640 [Hyphomicrobiaceae bacterium]
MSQTTASYTAAEILAAGRAAEAQGNLDYARRFYRHIVEFIGEGPEVAEADEALRRLARTMAGPAEEPVVRRPEPPERSDAAPRMTGPSQTFAPGPSAPVHEPRAQGGVGQPFAHPSAHQATNPATPKSSPQFDQAPMPPRARGPSRAEPLRADAAEARGPATRAGGEPAREERTAPGLGERLGMAVPPHSPRLSQAATVEPARRDASRAEVADRSTRLQRSPSAEPVVALSPARPSQGIVSHDPISYVHAPPPRRTRFRLARLIAWVASAFGIAMVIAAAAVLGLALRIGAIDPVVLLGAGAAVIVLAQVVFLLAAIAEAAREVADLTRYDIETFAGEASSHKRE